MSGSLAKAQRTQGLKDRLAHSAEICKKCVGILNKLPRIPAMNFQLYLLAYPLLLITAVLFLVETSNFSDFRRSSNAMRRPQSEYSSIAADTKFPRISFKIHTDQ